MAGLSFLELNEQADEFEVLLAHLTVRPTFSDQEVEKLRQALYRDGRFDQRRAAEIFDANRAMPAPCSTWAEFYLEALTDLFLDQDRKGHRLSTKSEAVVLDCLGDDVSALNLGERRLLARIMLRTADVSDRFERFVFASFRHHLLHEYERWLGGQVSLPGTIDALDLQTLRRLILWRKEHSTERISITGLDFLFDLDKQPVQFTEPRGWLHLLTEGAAYHLCDLSMSRTEPTSAPMLNVETSEFIKRILFESRSSSEAADLHEEIKMTATRLLEITCTSRQTQDN